MNCANCQHFMPQSDEQGLCRRYPPTVAVLPNHSTVSLFPPMLNDGVCGEHKEKTND